MVVSGWLFSRERRREEFNGGLIKYKLLRATHDCKGRIYVEILK